MKNKRNIFLLVLMMSLRFISAQGFIKGEYRSYQYEIEPRVVTKDEYYFDQDMYLKKIISKSVLDKKWDKELKVDCENRKSIFIINISEKNVNYSKERNEGRTYFLQKDKDIWNLFYNSKMLGIISYSSDLEECYYYSNKEKTKEVFYSRRNNEYSLFNRQYILRNGIFYEKNVGGNEIYKLTDDNRYEIKYSYEGLESEYEFTKDYYCTDINQICVLWLLRNDINSFLLPYLFCKLDRAYHSTSYLTEGNTTYEPEHLQQKDGQPWASGNGSGIGDVISIKEFEHKNPTTLKIMNGYQDPNHPDYYEKNSRVKKIKVTNTDTQKSKSLIVKDIKNEQTLDISDLGKGQNYDIEIQDIYEGNKYKDLCIQYLVVE